MPHKLEEETSSLNLFKAQAESQIRLEHEFHIMNGNVNMFEKKFW